MAAADEKTVRVYRELAETYERQHLGTERDRFLVLAADAALSAGRAEEAERLRQRLLQVNPHHLLKPYASLAEAVQSTDVQNYLAGLRRTYPPETAAALLAARGREGAGKAPSPTPPPKAPEPAGKPSAAATETVPAYRLQDTPEGRQAPRPESGGRRPAPTSAPAGAAPPVRKEAPAPTAADMEIYSLRDRPRTGGAGVPGGQPPPATGAWLCLILFTLAFLGGLAVAVYTITKPFLGG